MTLKDFLLKLIKWVISTYWNNIASVRYFKGFISHLKLWNIIELHQKVTESNSLDTFQGQSTPMRDMTYLPWRSKIISYWGCNKVLRGP